MTPGDEKPLTNAALARHWGCSAPYVSKLSRPVNEGGKGMPEFRTLAEADAWRSVNAPPKAANARPASSNQGAEAEKKIADCSDTTTAGDDEGGDGEPAGEIGERLPANNPDEGDAFKLSEDASKDPSAKEAREKAAAALRERKARTSAPPPPPEIIDVTKFITPGADFETLMIAQAEEVPQVARGLFLRACSRGNPNEISAANRNWHESAKSAYAVRADFIELQEKTRALISIDDVRDVLGTELQAARSAFLKLGERIASKANPADPTAAKAVIDAAVDEIFRNLDAALERGARDLAQPKAS